MPKRIIIIGALFCLSGVLAIIDTVAALFDNHLTINFGILMLPVGIGIFRARSSSQWWARFWIILGYISCGILIVLSILMPENMYINCSKVELRGSEAVPYMLLGSSVTLIFLIVVHRLLYSEKSIAYFKKTTEKVDGFDVE